MQTLINYIFTLAVDGGSYDTVDLTFSLKQTGCCKIFFTKYPIYTLAFTSNH